MGREETPVPVTPTLGHLGTLFLVGRKSGEDLQSFPIDAEKVTIGRDYDCDVRLYFNDVSKLHCEILFDLMTNQAALHIHSPNGVLYTPNNGKAAQIKPTTIIQLNDKDIFSVRKKVFRFEYARSSATAISPSLTPSVAASHEQPVSPGDRASQNSDEQSNRRRTSRRLSLVPVGQSFQPLSPAKMRRHSQLLLEGTHAGPLSSKSALSTEVTKDAEGEEEENAPLVEVVDGEDGDVLYMEVQSTDTTVTNFLKPFYERGFMTPQQTRKVAPRNTSAVPRTRKTAPYQPSHAKDLSLDRQERDQEQPRTPPGVPKTPRSIPLPPTSDTPYDPQPTPVIRVPAQVVMSTPRGPVNLHKALLIHSARKVWEESRPAGVEGAIETGDITIGRKSLSPKSRTPKKNLTTMPVPQSLPESKESEKEQYVEMETRNLPTGKELQWVHEDGRGGMDLDESDSDLDSLEADVSLDIPGDGVLDLEAPNIVIVQATQGSQEKEQPEELEAETHEDIEIDAVKKVDGDELVDVEEGSNDELSDDVRQPALPGTPAARRALDRFFTPQPRRTGANQPRRSLASIGGPAVRFNRLPSTPGRASGVHIKPAPGTLGKPSRRLQTPVREEIEDIEEKPKPIPATPIRMPATPAMLADIKRRHESLATPRALPAPPSTGFRNLPRDKSLRSVMASPSHPALAPTSPEAENHTDTLEGRTPMDDVKARLSKMRRQSIHRQSINAMLVPKAHAGGRRATVGLALPSTPAARPTSQKSAYFTGVNPAKRYAQVPDTPIFAALEGSPLSSRPELQDTIVSVSSVRTVSLHDILPQRKEETGNADNSDSSDEAQETRFGTPKRNVPSEPPVASVKVAMKPSVQPKTPFMRDISRLYPAPTAKPVVPATPSFQGFRNLFASRQPPPTPAMDGVADMYELPEEQESSEVEETEEVEEEADMVEVVSSPFRSSPVKAEATQAAQLKSSTSRSLRAVNVDTIKEESSSASVIASTTLVTAPSAPAKAPARRGRTAKTAEEVDAASSKPSRGRKATAEPNSSEDVPLIAKAPARKAASVPCRTKRTAAVVVEVPLFTATSRSKSSRTRIHDPVVPVTEPVLIEEAPRISSRNKSASSRTTRTVGEPAPEPAGNGRGKAKKPLSDSTDQEEVHDDIAEPAPKTTRGKTAAAPKKDLASSTASAAVNMTEEKSVPSRRTRGGLDKENAPEVMKEEEKGKRGKGKGAVVEGTGGAITTRSTRSRK